MWDMLLKVKFLTTSQPNLLREEPGEGDPKGAPEVLVHESVDDRVGGWVDIDHILRHRHQRVVVLLGEARSEVTE